MGAKKTHFICKCQTASMKIIMWMRKLSNKCSAISSHYSNYLVYTWKGYHLQDIHWNRNVNHMSSLWWNFVNEPVTKISTKLQHSHSVYLTADTQSLPHLDAFQQLYQTPWFIRHNPLLCRTTNMQAPSRYPQLTRPGYQYLLCTHIWLFKFLHPVLCTLHSYEFQL